MQITSASPSEASVTLSRAEVLAIRNVVESASLLPLETRGPIEIFSWLAAEFGRLADAMSDETK